MNSHKHILGAALAMTLLSACGGGDEAPPPAPPPPPASDTVPDSASASPTAYVQYTASLAPSETAEPLKVDTVVPPTSETAEPLDV